MIDWSIIVAGIISIKHWQQHPASYHFSGNPKFRLGAVPRNPRDTTTDGRSRSRNTIMPRYVIMPRYPFAEYSTLWMHRWQLTHHHHRAHLFILDTRSIYPILPDALEILDIPQVTIAFFLPLSFFAHFTCHGHTSRQYAWSGVHWEYSRHYVRINSGSLALPPPKLTEPFQALWHHHCSNILFLQD